MLGCDTAYEVNRWNHVGGTVGRVPGKDLLEEMRIWAIGGDSGYRVQKIKTNSETIHFRLGLELMCRNLNPTKTLCGIPIHDLLIRITHLVSRATEAQVPCVPVQREFSKRQNDRQETVVVVQLLCCIWLYSCSETVIKKFLSIHTSSIIFSLTVRSYKLPLLKRLQKQPLSA